MSRYLVEQIGHNDYILYDIQFFGLQTAGMSGQECIVKKKDKYYIHYWQYGGEFYDDVVTDTKINYIEQYDTLEQVKEKYIVDAKEDEWFGCYGFFDYVRISLKK